MTRKQNRKVGNKKRFTGSDTRPQSKKMVMVQLLQRPAGVTMEELMAASGWQAHSVRGFLSAGLRRRMGLQVNSSKRDDGPRVYRIRRCKRLGSTAPTMPRRGEIRLPCFMPVTQKPLVSIFFYSQALAQLNKLRLF